MLTASTAIYRERYMSTSTDTSQLLTARQAAAQLAISTRKLWELSNRREIASIRIGRSVRYAPNDLAAYIASQRSGGAK